MQNLTEHEKSEREKARELRKSSWWKTIRGQGICHYCKARFSPHQITMDHVIPISSGGKSVKSNIVPACKNCNTEKSDRDKLSDLFAEIEQKKESP